MAGNKGMMSDKALELRRQNSASLIKRGKASPTKSINPSGQNPFINRIIHLQKTAGNKAVKGLIGSLVLKRRLRLGKPDDKYEKEAEHTAGKVMAMPAHVASQIILPYGVGNKIDRQTIPFSRTAASLIQMEEEEIEASGSMREKEKEEETQSYRSLNEEEEKVETQVSGLEKEEDREEEAQAYRSLDEEDKEEETEASGLLIKDKVQGSYLIQSKDDDNENEEVQAEVITQSRKEMSQSKEDIAQPRKEGAESREVMTQSWKERAHSLETMALSREVMTQPWERTTTSRNTRAQEVQTDSFIIAREGEKGEKEEEGEAGEEGAVQAKALTGWNSEIPTSIEESIRNQRGGGHPLSANTRSFFEPRFRYDFSRVRVHKDFRSSNTAERINARAFTVGRDIFFGAGEYRPEKRTGRKLIAHELTHVVQQGGGRRLSRSEVMRRWNLGAHRLNRFEIERQNDKSNERLSDRSNNWLNDRDIDRGIDMGMDRDIDKGMNRGMEMGTGMDMDVENQEMIHGKQSTLTITRIPVPPLTPLTQGNPLIQRKKKGGSFFESIGAGIKEGITKATGNLFEKARKYVADKAREIPGYKLILHILGKDPITGKKVAKRPGGILNILLSWLGAEKTYKNMVQSKVVAGAYRILLSAFRRAGLTWGFVVKNIKGIWTFLKSNPLSLGRAFGMARDFLSSLIKKAIRVGKWLLIKVPPLILRGFLILVGAPVKTIMGILNRGKGVILQIAKNPMRFVGYLVKALKKGFFQFKGNIWKHLKAGLFGWLFGTLQKAGITMPAKFDLKGIFYLVMQILGLTYAHIRERIVKIIGEENMQRLEKIWEFVRVLVTGGIGALWEKLKESLSSLGDVIIGAVKNWVVTKIVTAAITKLATMFNPVGAIIQAALAIYNTVMFFIERAKQIAALVNAVLSSISNIAYGRIKAAANWIERSMARTIPVILSFLARLLNLGGIGEKIKKVIANIRARIHKPIDKLIKFIVGKAKALFGRIKKGAKKLKEKGLAVVDWLRQRRRIKSRKKTYTLYVQGNEKSSQVMVSASAGKTFSVLLKELKKKRDKDNKPMTNKEKIAYEEAENLIKIINKRSRAKKNESEDQKNSREKEFYSNKIKAFDALAIQLMILIRDDDTPISVIQFGELNADQGGTKAEASILSREHPKGSKVRDKPPIWVNLGPLRYRAPYYVQGHLLNADLGGPGKRFNLSPITKKANSMHYHKVEKKVKDWVHNEKFVVYYQVKARYPKPLSEDEERFKTLKEKPEANRTLAEEEELASLAEKRLAEEFICTYSKLLEPEKDGKWDKEKREYPEKVIKIDNKKNKQE